MADQADFVFFAHSTDDLQDKERRFTLSPQDMELLNPNTRTCPIFRSKRDAELTKAIYRRVPVLVREARGTLPEENPWGITFNRMFDMSNDSHLFRTREELETEGWELRGNVFVRPDDDRRRYLPLYEAKMVHQFNHRWATYADTIDDVRDTTPSERRDRNFSVLPRYWVCENEVWSKLEDAKWPHEWLMGWRDITNATNERTVISGVIPACAVGNKFPLLLVSTKYSFWTCALSSCLDSFANDYVARQKMGGTTLNFFLAKQLAVLPPQTLDKPAPWQPDLSLAEWLTPRILELTYTAEDLRPFAEDMGYNGEPFVWDEERRFQLRAELDAAFFHL